MKIIHEKYLYGDGIFAWKINIYGDGIFAWKINIYGDVFAWKYNKVSACKWIFKNCMINFDCKIVLNFCMFYDLNFYFCMDLYL